MTRPPEGPLPAAVPILALGIGAGILGALPLCCLAFVGGPAGWFAVRTIEPSAAKPLHAGRRLAIGLGTGFVAGAVSGTLGPAWQLGLGAFDDPALRGILDEMPGSITRGTLVALTGLVLAAMQIGASILGALLAGDDRKLRPRPAAPLAPGGGPVLRAEAAAPPVAPPLVPGPSDPLAVQAEDLGGADSEAEAWRDPKTD